MFYRQVGQLWTRLFAKDAVYTDDRHLFQTGTSSGNSFRGIAATVSRCLDLWIPAFHLHLCRNLWRLGRRLTQSCLKLLVWHLWTTWKRQLWNHASMTESYLLLLTFEFSLLRSHRFQLFWPRWPRTCHLRRLHPPRNRQHHRSMNIWHDFSWASYALAVLTWFHYDLPRLFHPKTLFSFDIIIKHIFRLRH